MFCAVLPGLQHSERERSLEGGEWTWEYVEWPVGLWDFSLKLHSGEGFKEHKWLHTLDRVLGSEQGLDLRLLQNLTGIEMYHCIIMRICSVPQESIKELFFFYNCTLLYLNAKYFYIKGSKLLGKHWMLRILMPCMFAISIMPLDY